MKDFLSKPGNPSVPDEKWPKKLFSSLVIYSFSNKTEG
jgi:hypothetical protein